MYLLTFSVAKFLSFDSSLLLTMWSGDQLTLGDVSYASLKHLVDYSEPLYMKGLL